MTVGLAEQGGEACSSEVANVKGEKAVKAEGSTNGTLLRVKNNEPGGHRFEVQVFNGFGNSSSVCGSGAPPGEITQGR